MNFDFSDDQKQMRDAARKFLTEKCPPKAVREVLDGKAPYDKALWKAVFQLDEVDHEKSAAALLRSNGAATPSPATRGRSPGRIARCATSPGMMICNPANSESQMKVVPRSVGFFAVRGGMSRAIPPVSTSKLAGWPLMRTDMIILFIGP